MTPLATEKHAVGLDRVGGPRAVWPESLSVQLDRFHEVWFGLPVFTLYPVQDGEIAHADRGARMCIAIDPTLDIERLEIQRFCFVVSTLPSKRNSLVIQDFRQCRVICREIGDRSGAERFAREALQVGNQSPALAALIEEMELGWLEEQPQ